MPTTNRQPNDLSAARVLPLIVIVAVVVFALSWNSKQPSLATDAEMIGRWQTEKSQWLDLVETCQQADTSYRLPSRYSAVDKLISLGSLESFSGCDLNIADPGRASDFLHVAQSGNTTLLVSDQRRKGTGWIEEKASQWSSGWVSWKSAILEGKGFVYSTQDARQDSVAPPIASAEITPEPLDQFVGKYRGTSQISGNSSCELWKLRPIESDTDNSAAQSTWYLFYHQARECPS